MLDADYLRARANLCLEIAQHMSDNQAAQKLRSDAARYRAQADEIEKLDRSSTTSGNGK